MFKFCVEVNEIRGGKEIVHLFNDETLPGDLKFSWTCKDFLRFAFRNSIYSMSSNPLQPLLWAHYAASYTGFVLEFDTKRETSSFWFDGPHKVRYARRPPSVHISDLVTPDGIAYSKLSDLEQSVLFTKSGRWRYEGEWRLVARGKPSGAQIQPYAISAVYFGYRMPREQRAQVMSVLGDSVRYLAVVPALQEYSLRTIDPSEEALYLRDFDRSIRTMTFRTTYLGTSDFVRHPD